MQASDQGYSRSEHVDACGQARTALYSANPFARVRFTEPPLASRPAGDDHWRKGGPDGPLQLGGNCRSSHSFPLRSLRVRRFCSDPQALLPLALPDARWPTGPGAGRPSAAHRCKGAALVRPLRGEMPSMMND